jgi:hypothetical protein
MSQSLPAIAGRRNDWPVAVAEYNGDGADFPRGLDEQLTRLIRWFEEAERASMDSRRQSELCRQYVDGVQWTDAELKTLNDRHQPPITFNHCRRKIDILCGLERKARTDPKAFPRTPTEDDRADAATQALRYIADNNDFQPLRSNVFNEMLVEGFGGLEVGLEDDGKGGADITLKQVPWDRIWYDPHSRQDDFLDARYKGIVIWMDKDQLLELYPDAGDVIDTSFSHNDATQYDDRPEYLTWTDSQRTRCRVVQCHWSERGEWWSATYTRSGYLTEPQRSRFKDRHGKSGCPLILQSSYTALDNTRYGMMRDLISPQDMINKAFSKAIHQMAVHQVIAEQGAVQDVDKARREVARPDGYVEVTPGMKFEVADGNVVAQGQFQLLQHAVQEMQLSGPNAAMSGTDPRELSGRAILAQQAGGATQNEPLADSLRMWARRVYEMCWQAAREYWTAGKWVRVTDDLNETRWVGINRQVTLQDKLAEMPEQQRAMAMQQMQLQPGDPRLQQVVGVQNDITDMDVDITVAEGQDVPALQAETFQTLVQLASIQPGLIPGDVLIAASSLRDKDAILERMKQHQQQQAQMGQQVAQVKAQQAQAGIAKDQGQAAANMALAQERKVNAARGVHDIHADFSADPYGQPNVAPDNPPGASDPGAQMPPDVALAHHIADLAKKHADIQQAQANVQKTQADAALQAAKIGQVPHETAATQADTFHTLHQAANTMVQTNRLTRTPIPQPGQTTPSQ